MISYATFRFIFVLTRPEWRFKRCCGGRPWTDVRYDLHFILMSALNGYRLLRSACSQPPPSPLPLAQMIISREKSRWWGMLHATFIPVTGQLPFGASIVIKTLSSPQTQLLWSIVIGRSDLPRLRLRPNWVVNTSNKENNCNNNNKNNNINIITILGVKDNCFSLIFPYVSD